MYSFNSSIIMETSEAQLPPNEGEWKRKYEELYERLNRAEEENKKLKRAYEEENKKWQSVLFSREDKIQECKTHKEKLSQKNAKKEEQLKALENVLRAVRFTRDSITDKNVSEKTKNLLLLSLFQYVTPQGITNKALFNMNPFDFYVSEIKATKSKSADDQYQVRETQERKVPDIKL